MLKRIPTRLLSYIYAVIIMLAAEYFTGALTLSAAALLPVNAIIIATSASGGYDALRSVGKNGKRAAAAVGGTSKAESAAASTAPSDNADNSDCNISSYAQGKTDKVSDTVAAEDLDTGNPAVVGKDTSGSVSGAADSSDNDTEKAEDL